jgi:NADH dehydrogenase
MATPVAAIFGGSGFIGRYIVERLAKQGWIMRIAVRRPDQALFLKPLGDIAQIVPIGANIRHERSVANAVQGVDTVINLVGILHEGGRQRFNAVHVEGVRRLARAATGAGVRRFLHVSSLGADLQSRSFYARSKAEGEATLREHFPAAIILRPSVVFGPEDDFFNRFAAMAQFSPALPLIGGGKTRFQPVYVGDVADAAAAALNNPALAGKVFEIGGPRAYSFRELMEMMLAVIGRRRLLLPVPFPVAVLQAAFLGLLPKPLLTLDQLRQLRSDNVLSGKAPGLEALGISATGPEAILPAYLDRYRHGGHIKKAEA